MWVMEPDVAPLRPRFLDAMYLQAIEPSAFMIKGTMHRGLPGFEYVGASVGAEPASMLEDHGWALRSQEWLQHMNGVALYGLTDPVLTEAARAAKVLQLSNPLMPYDVLLFLALGDASGKCRRCGRPRLGRPSHCFSTSRRGCSTQTLCGMLAVR